MSPMTRRFNLTSSRARLVSVNLLVAVACGTAAVLGGLFTFGHLNVAWPAAGVSLAVVFLLGPGILPGVALGAFAGELWLIGFSGAAVAIAVGYAAEAAFAGWLVRRLKLDVAGPRMLDVVGGLFVTVVAPLPAAVIGTSAMLLGGGHTGAEFARKLASWWIGDSVGILVFAPLMLGLGLSVRYVSLSRVGQIGRAHV